ncbi:Rad51C protein [Gorgonomyces haynaldii]|nr:Rad51C protein [Gorgonomyces haynaldii]
MISRSALEALEHDASITTGSTKLDQLMGHGIPTGHVTEICGVPGNGKTQLCMQLCINVQLPHNLGGLGSKAIYVDTEGSFTPKRLEQMVMAYPDLSKEEIMQNIEIYRIFDRTQLMSLVNCLESKLEGVRFVCFDSITFLLRGLADMSERTRLLHTLAQTLRHLASKYKIAIVLTNQMTTKFSKTNESLIVPALGESWGHACTNRIVLCWQSNMRHAWMTKSPYQADQIAPFAVTSEGIRDV